MHVVQGARERGRGCSPLVVEVVEHDVHGVTQPPPQPRHAKRAQPRPQQPHTAGAVARWWSSARRPPASSSRLRVRTAEPATASSEGGGAGGGEDGGTGVGVGAGGGGGGGGAEGSGDGGGEGGDGKGGHPGKVSSWFCSRILHPR